MRQGNIISYVLYFLLFFLLQIILFRNVVLFGYASCFIYLGYILIFPFDSKPVVLILISFFFGLLIDSFYDTIGINAFICVLVAYYRNFVIKILTPAGGYDSSSEFTVSYMGLIWFVKYAALIIFVHHFLFFLLEAWNIKEFFEVLVRAIFSSVFTLSVLLIQQYLFKKD